MKSTPPPDVDTYIAAFPASTRKLLKQVRAAIREAAPEATECISYQMPAYKTSRVLVYFAGYKHHIGFYPTASGIRNFEKEISGYTSSKGAVQFPLDAPLPLALVKKIVRFRLKEEKERLKAKLK